MITYADKDHSRAVVLCCGPSMQEFDLASLATYPGIVIAVNWAIRHGMEAGVDYWYTQKGAWIIGVEHCASVVCGRTVAVLGKPKSIKAPPEWWSAPPALPPLVYRQLGSLKACREVGGLCTEPGVVCGRNSGSAAVNLALHLGAKRIAILGFDCSVGRDIWDARKYTPASDPNAKNNHSWRYWMNDLAKTQVRDHWGAKIRNGSLISHCDTWEKLNHEEAVKWTLKN